MQSATLARLWGFPLQHKPARRWLLQDNSSTNFRACGARAEVPWLRSRSCAAGYSSGLRHCIRYSHLGAQSSGEQNSTFEKSNSLSSARGEDARSDTHRVFDPGLLLSVNLPEGEQTCHLPRLDGMLYAGQVCGEVWSQIALSWETWANHVHL